jgi:hypothetical protein
MEGSSPKPTPPANSKANGTKKDSNPAESSDTGWLTSEEGRSRASDWSCSSIHHQTVFKSEFN